jgi:hypothetical protein
MLQGIPYFYRQFGFEYAIALEGGLRVELHTVPEAPPDAAPYTFRAATSEDIPALVRLYDAAAADLDLSAVRDAATWSYLLGPSLDTEPGGDTFLVLDGDAQIVGYFRIAHYGFGEGVNVMESSRLSYDGALACLAHFKALALERDKPYIRLNLPSSHVLMGTARDYGAHDLGTYAWQLMIPDVARLLRKLAPVLETRIAASPFAGMTRRVTINLYREAFALDFAAGHVMAIEPLGFQEGGEISLPPLLLAPLVVGYRSHTQLAACYPDVMCHGAARTLIDTLFPPMESFIYTLY